MDKNKLGLKIIRVYAGVTDLLVLNGNQSWTQYVRDIREEFKNIGNLDRRSTTVLRLTGIDSGHLLMVASLIGGRLDDYQSAWIYIPDTLDISGKELVEHIDIVKTEILASKRDDEKLRESFSKTYGNLPAKRPTQSDKSESFAYRYYGAGTPYTLVQLLNDICQPCYKGYKALFFIDKATDLRFNRGDDLTSCKIAEMVVVSPPKPFDEYVPYINKQPFDEAVFASLGDTLTVEWRRRGYVTVVRNEQVKRQMEFSHPQRNEYKIVYPYGAIIVKDEQGNPIKEYDLKINDITLNDGRTIEISEGVFKQSQVKINADGYEDFCQVCDLTKRLIITLRKKSFSYSFSLEDKYGKELSFKYSRKGGLDGSPIMGYRIRDNRPLSVNRENTLEFYPYTKTVKIVFAILMSVMLLLGLGLGWYFTDMHYNKKIVKYSTEIKTLKKEINKAKKTAPKNNNKVQVVKTDDQDNIDEIVKMLDEKPVWDKTEMDKYPEIKGLWDALNERDFDTILKYEKKLEKSKVFKEIIAIIKKNPEREFKESFCTNKSDTKITIQRYKNILSGSGKQNVSSKQTPTSAKKVDNKVDSKSKAEENQDKW